MALALSRSTDEIKDFEVGSDRLVFNGFHDGQIGMQAVDGGTLVWAKDGEHVSDAVMLWSVDASVLADHATASFVIQDVVADRAGATVA